MLKFWGIIYCCCVCLQERSGRPCPMRRNSPTTRSSHASANCTWRNTLTTDTGNWPCHAGLTYSSLVLYPSWSLRLVVNYIHEHHVSIVRCVQMNCENCLQIKTLFICIPGRGQSVHALLMGRSCVSLSTRVWWGHAGRTSVASGTGTPELHMLKVCSVSFYTLKWFWNLLLSNWNEYLVKYMYYTGSNWNGCFYGKPDFKEMFFIKFVDVFFQIRNRV